jgi:hypothetical protein
VKKHWSRWLLLPLFGIILYVVIFVVLAPLGVRYVLTRTLPYQAAKKFIANSAEIARELGTPIISRLKDGRTYSLGTLQTSDFDVIVAGPRKRCLLSIELVREREGWVPGQAELKCPGSSPVVLQVK